MDIAVITATSSVWPVPATARTAEGGSATSSPGNGAAARASRAEGNAPPPAHPVRSPDPEAPTGPPPAFSTTPLERDGNLSLVLARLNASGYAQVQALSGKPPSPAAKPDDASGGEAGTRSKAPPAGNTRASANGGPGSGERSLADATPQAGSAATGTAALPPSGSTSADLSGAGTAPAASPTTVSGAADAPGAGTGATAG